jgi:hypothetical protein
MLLFRVPPSIAGREQKLAVVWRAVQRINSRHWRRLRLFPSVRAPCLAVTLFIDACGQRCNTAVNFYTVFYRLHRGSACINHCLGRRSIAFEQ